MLDVGEPGLGHGVTVKSNLVYGALEVNNLTAWQLDQYRLLQYLQTIGRW